MFLIYTLQCHEMQKKNCALFCVLFVPNMKNKSIQNGYVIE